MMERATISTLNPESHYYPAPPTGIWVPIPLVGLVCPLLAYVWSSYLQLFLVYLTQFFCGGSSVLDHKFMGSIPGITNSAYE